MIRLKFLEQWLLSFGPVGGNIIKNTIIALSIGFVLFAVAVLLMAKLFLIYKKALDKVNHRLLHDIVKGIKPVDALKKPMDAYMPDDVAVMVYGDKKGEKNYLLNPTSIPEVIDICLALLILKARPYRIFHNLSLPRTKTIFYILIVLMLGLSYVGLMLIIHINGSG